MNAQDSACMETALLEARRALAEGEIPVGAALYRGDVLLWADHNRREGARAMGDWRLKDCTLYVTLEPCPMCAGALLMSRLGRCVFGAADPEMGCCGSVYDLPADPALHGDTRWEQRDPDGRCRELLSDGFRTLRPSKGAEKT